MTGRPPTPEAVRFWAKVQKTKTCWFWTGSVCRGYGQFRRGPEHGCVMIKAHVWAYEDKYGPLQNLGLHTCDTGHCVNPDHIYDGTHQNNSNDCFIRGRRARLFGPANPMYGKRKVRGVWKDTYHAK